MRRNELYHHGIKGMQWGIRRYQNEDGTLTEIGRRRLSGGGKKIRELTLTAEAVLTTTLLI